MSNIGSIFKAVEFVEAHLQEEIAVADIASAGIPDYSINRHWNIPIKYHQLNLQLGQ